MFVRRRPGIVFETRTPLARPSLPRMDIAGFVGFAARGPLDLPVPIEDNDRFDEIFGTDQPLAWNRDTGTRAYGHLAPTVRSFFANGGQRCWVVRVADRPSQPPDPMRPPPIRNRFRIPGLISLDENDQPAAVAAVACSPGSWSSALVVNATLGERALRCQREVDALRITGARDGELLHIVFATAHLSLWTPAPPAAGTIGRRASTIERTIPLDSGTWVRELSASEFVGAVGSGGRIGGLHSFATVRPLAVAGDSADRAPQALTPVGWAMDGPSWVLDVEGPVSVAPGTWITAEGISLASLPSSSMTALLLVEEHRSAGDDLGSRPSVSITQLLGSRALVFTDAAEALAAIGDDPGAAFACELSLWVRGDAIATYGQTDPTVSRLRRLDGLGLAPGHPRYWGDAPDDAALFARPFRTDEALPEALGAVFDRPRFPLAASGVENTRMLLPLGAHGVPDDERYQGAIEPARGNPLVLDGLSRFDERLFVDDRLVDSDGDELIEEGLRLDLLAGNQPDSRLLGPRGMHALLAIEEVSAFAVPDAAQRGWDRDEAVNSPSDPLTAPELAEPVIADDRREAGLSWTPVVAADAYGVEVAARSGFEDATPLARADTTSVQLPTTARHRVTGRCCPQRFYYRVRAHAADGRTSPWSNTRAAWLPAVDFVAHEDDLLAAPVLTIEADGERVALSWSGPGSRFVLQSSPDPEFDASATLFDGDQRSTSLWPSAVSPSTGEPRPQPTLFFRVRAFEAERESPWSATVAMPGATATGFAVAPLTRYARGVLLAVHRAAIRLAAARGDLHTVLSLPLHFDDAETARHAAALLPQGEAISALAPAETDITLSARAPSHAVLHRPWLQVRDAIPGATGELRTIPADGALCGVLAARSLGGGAWLSAANQPLAGVVALIPSAEVGSFPSMPAGVNPIVRTSRGFVFETAETASLDPELRELSVRRLLILLRRLALREGASLAFAANDQRLRRRAERRFTAMLADLYARGAFAGATETEAFRVRSEDGAEFLANVELGRLVIELRVAPALPLTFLTVRLVQTDGGSFDVRET